MTASTQGWDTAYAMRFDRLNRIMDASVAAGETVLPHIDETTSTGRYTAAVTGVHLVGDPGLSGTRVKLCLTLGAGTVDLGSASAPAPKPVGQVTITGSADLARLEDDHHVSIILAPADCLRGAVVTGAGLSPLQTGVISAAVVQAITRKPDLLSKTVAVVDTYSPVAEKAPWLSPVEVRHCVSGGVLGGSADQGTILAVLTMTAPFVKGNPVPVANFDGTILGDTDDAAFLLAGSKFARNILLPGLANGLFRPASPFTADQMRQCEADHFQVDEAAGSVRLKANSDAIPIGTYDVDLTPLYGIFSGSIAMPPSIPFAVLVAIALVASQLIIHQTANLIVPMGTWLEGMDVKRDGSRFSISSTVRCELAIGQLQLATIRVTSTSNYKLVLQTDGSFLFASDGEPLIGDPDVTAPDWLNELGMVGKIVAAVVGLIATVVTAGEAAVAIGIIIALVGVAMQITPTLIAASLSHGTGIAVPAEIRSFISAASSPVSWFRGSSFEHPKLEVGDDLSVVGKLSG